MRIAVAGAGIAGLTSALALAGRGFSVEVFEQALRLEEVGAGIQLSPNAMKLLQRLGVADDLQPHLVEPRAIEIRDALSGRTLAVIPLGEAARRRYGAPYALIHRADLQAALYAAVRRCDGVAVRLPAEVHDVRATESGVTFRAAGQSFRADVLVAADGINSRLRTGYFAHSAPQPLGKAAWRAILPAALAPASVPRDVTGLWLGPGGHLVHYPVQAGAQLNVVVIANEGGTSAQPPNGPFGPSARQLIESASVWMRWPLFEHDPALPWVRGRVVLVGDAAHAMAPSAAQGGAQAIEDAFVLAAALVARREEPAEALLAYERERRPRVVRVAREARRNLAIYNLGGAAALARNAVLTALPTNVLVSRLDWLFNWQASQKTI
jgi:salicylate hydroxylase